MNELTRNEIVRRWQTKQSMRQIAAQLKLSRHTVRRVLTDHQTQRSEGALHPDLPHPVERRPSLLDVYEETCQQLLARYPNITAVRLLEELRAAGFRGGYTIVKERLRELRPRPARQPVVRFETGPGVQAQMDYAVYHLDFTEEGRRRVNLFSYLLAYSRRQYLRFVEFQDFEATLREHVRAFEHLGGVAATCLYDNMKVVVARHDGDEPIYNTRFLAFATHYGFRPWACRRRTPRTKGKVERPFFFVETNLLNGRTFRSLAHLNEVTARWLSEVADVRIHRETQRRPLDMHAEELPHLIPLPAHPYDTAEVIYRAVNAEGFVAYRQNFYSVPWRYIGSLLPLRITEQELIIYGPQLAELDRHPLFPRTATRQRSLLAGHQPSEDAGQRLAVLKERFAELGPIASRFLEGLLETQRCGKEQARRVLSLLGLYRRADVVAALERAVRFRAFSAASVERILAAQARPKTTWDALAEDQRNNLPTTLQDGPVPPRPTGDYQDLLFEELPPDGQKPEEDPSADPESP